MAKLSWIWKVGAALMGAAVIVGGIMAISKSLRKKDDSYCWPNNAEFKKCNDEAWQKMM